MVGVPAVCGRNTTNQWQSRILVSSAVKKSAVVKASDHSEINVFRDKYLILDPQPLSVTPSFLEFNPGLTKSFFFYPRSGHVPKVPTHVARPAVPQPFNPPPFQSSDQDKLNLLCPIRTLDTYFHNLSSY